MPDLLLELFSEEIPARMQARAAADLKRLVTDGLVERGLTYEGGAAHAGPRRLALDLRGLAKETPTRREERKGPRVGAPEKAVEGFLRSTGLTRDQLVEKADKKGAVYMAEIVTAGRPAAAVIAETVSEAVRGFPWPKSMRWGDGDLRWVRPLHSILCLLIDEAGAEIVPFEVGGLTSGGETRGHRFMAPHAIRPTSFDDYAAKLEAAKVVLSAEDRAARIQEDARTLAFAQGLELVEDPGLLAEVAGLVEWPVALMGEIGEEFLDLPPEVLRTSMKEHQKFFSVSNPATGRIERFVTIANIEATDGGAMILSGNRRVLAARLADAKFFWENDLRGLKDAGEAGMAAMAAPLASVTFHSRLGAQADRVARIEALAREIAPALGAEPDDAALAARICKADLTSEMVFEFPELQGVMGGYYAAHAGLAPEIAAACAEHYAPLGPSDAVPAAPVSATVALADKIDMLTGFWAADEKPTGSKDPFALRRAALGVLRILIEHAVRESLIGLTIRAFNRHVEEIAAREKRALLADADLAEAVGAMDDDLLGAAEGVLKARFAAAEENERARVGRSLVAAVDLARFVGDRLKVYLRDRGLRHDVIEAATLAPHVDVVAVRVKKAEALQAFLDGEDGANLLAGYRRAANILAAEEKKDGVEYSLDPDPSFAETDVERALFAALDTAEPALAAALEAEDFAGAMGALAALRAPIDAFFETVVVNAESGVLRRNRLCLLHRIRAAMERVAAFGALEG